MSSFVFEVYPDQPIIYSKPFGNITPQVFREWRQQCQDAVQHFGVFGYVVFDVREAHTDLGSLMTNFREASKENFLGLVGKTPTAMLIFVGTDTMAKLAISFLQQIQFGGASAPMFKTLDDALAFIRVDIADRNP